MWRTTGGRSNDVTGENALHAGEARPWFESLRLAVERFRALEGRHGQLFRFFALYRGASCAAS